MPAEHSLEVKFEIGHVLFIDIVGYSKLLITEQSDQLQTLRQIIRGTEQFRKAEAEGKLLRLPTGDGGALATKSPGGWRVIAAASGSIGGVVASSACGDGGAESARRPAATLAA